MLRTVVTGGNGFIGTHLVRRLAERGDEVVVFDAAPPAPGPAGPYPAGSYPPGSSPPGSGVRQVTGDIRDPDAVAAAFAGGANLVLHLAAVVGVDQYLARPLDTVDICLTGTRRVLESAARAGAAKVVLASTSEVYGRNPAVPWREDADRVLGPTTADRWTYSTAKALAEHTAFAWSRSTGTALTVVRYFNVYGPGQRPAYVISRSIHRALRGLAPVSYDGGTQTRCFTWIGDAVEGTLRAAGAPAADGECVNLGSGTETTIAALLHLIGTAAGIPAEPAPLDTATALGTRYEDIQRRVPDVTKAHRLLDWQATTPLPEGIHRTLTWARANPAWLALPESGPG